MNKLDESILQDFGLDKLPEETKKAALHDIYETLQMRIGMRLANQMTDEQAATFNTMKDLDDQDAFMKWLEETFPNFEEIMATELQSLKNEVNTNAAKILGADS